jgi:hypothetical protein
LTGGTPEQVVQAYNEALPDNKPQYKIPDEKVKQFYDYWSQQLGIDSSKSTTEPKPANGDLNSSTKSLGNHLDYSNPQAFHQAFSFNNVFGDAPDKHETQEKIKSAVDKYMQDNSLVDQKTRDIYRNILTAILDGATSNKMRPEYLMSQYPTDDSFDAAYKM